MTLHLVGMPRELNGEGASNSSFARTRVLLWMSGAWVLLPLGVLFWGFHASEKARTIGSIMAVLAAPLPAVILLLRQRRKLIACAASSGEDAAKLKLQLDTVRYRTTRLREELQAADRQARLSHQLTLLGQFTAGFMHEFNNPLAIVSGRIEVLLEERKEDDELCKDLQEMLKETRYMGKVATTLLQALRRERGSAVFEPAAPQEAIQEAVTAFRPPANEQKVKLIEELGEAPRVDVPEHVVAEVVRGLLSNGLKALKGQDGGTIWVRLDPYHTAGAKVVIRVEDNGHGVPESIRDHLFEPFITLSKTGERGLGLGLFLAASLLDMYDGRIRYETRNGGGASFVVELPPARFTRGQPYHWFAGEVIE
jgi:signal transduction histidine kinase